MRALIARLRALATPCRAALLAAFALIFALSSANAQGTVPIALQQSVNSNGQPLAGCLLYIFTANTVALTSVFQDAGLTIPAANPEQCDQNGRLPMFYLANGSVHVRLTDSGGVQQFDYPSMLVIGASGGSGGGGGVDPTTIFATGDYKFRPTGETLTGWVRANGCTMGSGLSGAQACGRANNDTQNLFIYLWTNCHLCVVSSGKGSTGLADFNANKTITLPDCRGRICGVGVDDMGNGTAGILLAQNIFSGGDTPTTAGALAGEDNHTSTLAQLPVFSQTSTFSGNAVTPVFTGTQQTWNVTFPANTELVLNSVAGNPASGAGLNIQTATATVTVTPAGTIGAITPSGTNTAITFGSSPI
jgi:hypothetical protein